MTLTTAVSGPSKVAELVEVHDAVGVDADLVHRDVGEVAREARRGIQDRVVLDGRHDHRGRIVVRRWCSATPTTPMWHDSVPPR